jgi:hypothetical protein
VPDLVRKKNCFWKKLRVRDSKPQIWCNEINTFRHYLLQTEMM